MKLIAVFLVLILIQIAYAETTGRIDIGTPASQEPAMTEATNFTADSGEKSNGKEENTAVIALILSAAVVSALLAKAYLFRRHK